MAAKRVRRQKPCSEPGCEATYGPKGKTGYCKRHATERTHADPEIQKRRLEGVRRKNAEPGFVARRSAAMLAGHANFTDEQKARRVEHGKKLARLYLNTPEGHAHRASPEVRNRIIASYIETKIGWCPPHLRDDYRRMVKLQHYTAAEAREIIEAEIPGTKAHARRLVRNTIDAMRVKEGLRRLDEA